MSIELKIPEVGESVQEVFLVRWLKEEGEYVEEDEDILELESEKASLEVPAPASGVLEKILHLAGATVRVGETVALIQAGDGTAAARTAPAAASSNAQGQTHSPQATAGAPDEPSRGKDSQPENAGEGRPRGTANRSTAADDDRGIVVTPSARRELRKHDLQVGDIPIRGDRMRSEDVERFVRERDQSPSGEPAQGAGKSKGQAKQSSAVPPTSLPTAPKGRSTGQGARRDQQDELLVPMSPIRRRIAERLVRGQNEAALLTTFNEIDMSAVIDLRRRHQERFQKKHGVKLGFMSFFVKATANALTELPELNAEIRDNHIVYRNGCHIGVAVGTSKGLMVPVLRHAELLGFADVELAIQRFAAAAEAGKLGPDDLQGGTFTISNGGVYGSLLSTPLINPPQSGVLGMHTIQERPIGVDGQIVLRPMMYVALSYDHRIVDGREAVTFLNSIKRAIEDPPRCCWRRRGFVLDELHPSLESAESVGAATTD
jgi:2-oxoglutarate dehydrogenase E2 component (dihydrolipoamide succinyltransferase)